MKQPRMPADAIGMFSPQLADSLLNSILALDVSDGTVPKPDVIPHCDCAEANRRHLGRMFKPNGRDKSRHEAFDQCPTEIRPGTKDVCLFCGYTTCLQTAKAISGHQADGTYDECAKKARIRRSQPVIGRCLSTGVEVKFNSAQDAYHAGFGSVNYAIKKTANGVIRGYQWRLA